MNGMWPSDVPASNEMTPATKELHTVIIRLLKGVISAWERWLQQQKDEPT